MVLDIQVSLPQGAITGRSETKKGILTIFNFILPQLGNHTDSFTYQANHDMNLECKPHIPGNRNSLHLSYRQLLATKLLRGALPRNCS